ncbi:hypothetical protein HYT91_00045 [Candidatus Pacearchaeota archaeon]|nr:hypothetical protein [Candidatus Pacearchaeota archaeon]
MGISHKNAHAQWNFPKLRTNPVLAKGIQASQGFLCLSFFPIVAQAKNSYNLFYLQMGNFKISFLLNSEWEVVLL